MKKADILETLSKAYEHLELLGDRMEDNGENTEAIDNLLVQMRDTKDAIQNNQIEP